jgi:hypothetical protein
MQLEDQAVLTGHAGHLVEHVTGERGRRLRFDGTRPGGREDAGRLDVVQRRGVGTAVTVVGGPGPGRHEVTPAPPEGPEIAGVVAGVDVGQFRQLLELARPAGVVDVQQRIGPEGRHDHPRPTRPGQLPVGRQVGQG